MSNLFRNRLNKPRLSLAEADRQSRIFKLALVALGPVGAIAFLNTHDELLGGSPLVVAVKSQDGFVAAERALRGHNILP